MTSLWTGFNGDKIKEVADELQKNADDAIANVITMIETLVVIPISSIWVSEEAVIYFNKFKEYVDKVPDAVYAYFDTFRQSLENAYKTWLKNTGGEVAEFDPTMSAAHKTFLTPIDANGEIKQLDISSIIPITPNGDRGANIEELDSFIVSLEGVKESIVTAIKVSNISQIEVALLGGEQVKSATAAYSYVYDLVEKLFDFLTIDDPDNGLQSLKSAMEAVIEKYGNTATTASSIFESYNSDSSQGTAA